MKMLVSYAKVRERGRGCRIGWINRINLFVTILGLYCGCYVVLNGRQGVPSVIYVMRGMAIYSTKRIYLMSAGCHQRNCPYVHAYSHCSMLVFYESY